jgi:type III restriction enzyme
MALHPNFPTSPYEIIEPEYRWFPADEAFRGLLYGQLIPPLVAKIREEVKKWRDKDYEGSSNTSKALLKHWFKTTHFLPLNDGTMFEFKYYYAQREAVETIIYLHEIAQIKDKYDLLRFDSSDAISESMFDENWSRFVIKMATGSGKTKVLSLILAWSYFHKLYEDESTLSRNFLVITPNIIVLDRIRADFDGLKIFYDDPIIPDNGFEGQNWRDDFQLTLHIQDNVNIVRKIGNIFLTNIHRVFDGHKKIPSFDDDNTSDYFLGDKPVGATTDSKVDLDVIVRDINELMVLNDEAHHIHDKKLAWFQSIQDIHNHLLQKNAKLSMQVDFTATPKKSNGSIFVQTVMDYPLVEAIHQNIVKHPVLPDDASRIKLKEKTSAKYSEKFEDYIHLGYLEWKKVYNEHQKLDKKAVLFVMTDDTKNCDEVAEYLENRYSELKDSVLVIHTKKNGEISEASTGKKKKELEELRKAANNIDSLESRYKAIVSVLVLKEGWDVRNVTTIVGLRAFASKAKILPEQTLGRGLRRMYRYPDVTEKVSVVGTDAFMEFVESIKDEGVVLDKESMGDKSPPKSPIVIEVDHDNVKKDINELNIKIPVLTPRIYREYDKLDEIDVSNFNNKKLKIKKFTEKEQREIVFRDIVSKEITHKTQLDGENAIDYRAIIGYFAQVIKKEMKLVSGYEILYGKIKYFIQDYLFEKRIDFEDTNAIRNLSELEVSKTIIETFKKEINKLTVQDKGEAEIREYINVSDTRPFVARDQEYVVPKKSVFNRIIGDSHLELEFAAFLEECDDIISYTKNYLAVHFKIDYQNSSGDISNYYPDFLVKKSDVEIYLIETKGQEDLDDSLKLERLKNWCEDINEIQNEIKYDFLYVVEENFHKYQTKNFQELIDVFNGSKPKSISKSDDIKLRKLDKWIKSDKETTYTEIETKIDSSDGKHNAVEDLEIESWIETLPFPLASILYAYSAEGENERKIKYLIHFFEALSEFNVTLILSALSQDLKFYQENFVQCINTNSKYRDWYQKPTFGNWNNFGSCLAKGIRRILETIEKRDKCLELFGNPSDSFIWMLTTSKIYNILFDVANYRNKWEGHGPLVNEKEYEKRLEILKNSLIELKSIISENYTNILILSPLKSVYIDGIYHYQASNLMTSRAPFRTIELKTKIPMENEKKYILQKGQLKPLELLPLVEIIESPEKEQEACYFYNGIDKKSKVAHYISYHFSKEAEYYIEPLKLENIFKLLGA